MLTQPWFRKERSSPGLRVLLVVRLCTGLEYPAGLWRDRRQRNSAQPGHWVSGAIKLNDPLYLVAPPRVSLTHSKVGWLPLFILASTVDRNLVSADSIRERLNNLVNDVRLALLDPQIVSDYMRLTSSNEEDFAWTQCLDNEELFGGDFFEDFAGQGRTHWHYGVAHPILCGIETKFMADYGRDWLRHSSTARLAIVVGSRNVSGLKMFDPRMIWQITSSMFVVCGSVGGAFILSCKRNGICNSREFSQIEC